MPIYAYRCSNCGHQQDVLQKISDPKLTVCPVCGEPAYVKQLTAAGFQLKGSGWYVTDFRDGKQGAKKDDAKADGEKPAPAADDGAAAKPADPPAPAPAAAGAPAAATPAASPAPAPPPAAAPPPKPAT